MCQKINKKSYDQPFSFANGHQWSLARSSIIVVGYYLWKPSAEEFGLPITLQKPLNLWSFIISGLSLGSRQCLVLEKVRSIFIVCLKFITKKLYLAVCSIILKWFKFLIFVNYWPFIYMTMSLVAFRPYVLKKGLPKYSEFYRRISLNLEKGKKYVRFRRRKI